MVKLTAWIAVAVLLYGCIQQSQPVSDRPQPHQTAPKVDQQPPSKSLPRGNQSVKRFRTAKKKLPAVFAKLGQQTLYCGCSYQGKTVSASSCGYVPKKATTAKGKVNLRAKSIEWEHIVPAHSFGGNLPSWQQHKSIETCQSKAQKSIGSRNCSRKLSAVFRYMEADLYNLFPAIGELNGYRSNLPMGEISGEGRSFGRCDFEVKNGKVEPRPSVRGLIARVYFYMNWAYPDRAILINKKDKLAMLETWDSQYPITSWEKNCDSNIERIQGNCNPFVNGCPNTLVEGSKASHSLVGH